MKRHMVRGLSALLLSLIAVAPAGAVAKPTVCQMDYTLKGWSAFYKTSRGSGTITCDNGQTARAKISAKGGGLTAGKSEIRDGHGKFSEVADIKELFGSYAKGEVSLALPVACHGCRDQAGSVSTGAMSYYGGRCVS